MKQLFIVNTHLMNGTVTMNTHSDAFITEDTALKVKAAIEKANENYNDDVPSLSVYCTIQTATLFESEEEIPILSRSDV